MKFSTKILVSILSATLAYAGAFNALSFNVAGLPQILQNNGEELDKDIATQKIGEDFASMKDQLDIINVQEDFNYHAKLYDYDNHPYRTATSGGVPFGSGLNTLSNYEILHTKRIKWNECSNASENDCLTPKGFTVSTLRLDGHIVNVINLHTDAGTEDDDNAKRNSNLKQVADYIDSNLYDQAVLVFGDTNSRYTRASDDIAIFTNQNGLEDPWIVLERNGIVPEKGADSIMCQLPSTENNCETVDKMFYRGDKTISFKADTFHYAGNLFVHEGKQLSDHNPILVSFTYTSSEDFKTSELIGGYHSNYFNDIGKINKGVKTTKISLKGANRLDSVGLTLSDGTKFVHGGSGGEETTVNLSTDEYWTKAYLCTGKKDDHTRIFYINGTTTTGKTFQAGTKTSDCKYFEAPQGYQITGYFGQSGDNVDLLGFIYIKQ
ncbi:putative secreted protein [Wickerhamomyces ciferrii]|uniref:Secreted protein n=1 Tax=Wickerhamomyces ciferrii (strain ATCC 14091 / BCRC 22168 / CBS 111 / JCM 3599 / NBRC 0793 / NRRL Y-1031 F-60-10) TaxID=1206466 RepID=K0KHC3_WICCF|nr:uncharacterized protein BN7_4184 [Wickerhamomyces ciferrii]CCH44615.1 putative secreted protein [Wickerhamomyces ciferrii]